MKRTLLFIVLLAAGCSAEYDLGRITTDGTALGDDDSDFRMPLATVTVRQGEVAGEGVDLDRLFREADIWLPGVLPDGDKTVDLERLTARDQAYLDTLLDALFAEMGRPETGKCASVGGLLWDTPRYREPLLAWLPARPGSREEFVNTFVALFPELEGLRQATRDVAGSFLEGLNVDPVTYRIDPIDVDDTIIERLCAGLGTSTSRSLGLYGEATSSIPVAFRCSPEFTGLAVRFAPFRIGPDGPTSIEETPLTEADLRALVNGTQCTLPLVLERYTPGVGFQADQSIRLTLRIHRRGALRL